MLGGVRLCVVARGQCFFGGGVFIVACAPWVDDGGYAGVGIVGEREPRVCWGALPGRCAVRRDFRGSGWDSGVFRCALGEPALRVQVVGAEGASLNKGQSVRCATAQRTLCKLVGIFGTLEDVPELYADVHRSREHGAVHVARGAFRPLVEISLEGVERVLYPRVELEFGAGEPE